MAFEPFNSVGGITVGIPPIPVISEDGIATFPGIQLAGIANLGSVNNIIITGGENGYFLQTDGEGHLTWAAAGNGGGGNGIPGGANSQVQFNNNGDFGGDAGFTYDNVNNILTVTGNIVSYNYTSTGNITAGNIVGTNLSVANVNATRISATGNLSVGNANLGNLAAANFYIGNGSLLTGIVATSANFANYAGNVTVSNQPNITTLGVLTSLSVSGNANVGNLNATSLAASTITVTGNATVGNITANTGSFTTIVGTLATTQQPNITSIGTLSALTVNGNALLGNVSNLHITGGSSGQVLTTNGNGTLSWQSAPASTTAQYVTANNQSNITSVGTLVSLTVNGITNLGDASNVKITGGTDGYVLSTDGTGNLSWKEDANAAPGGSNTQLQFNDQGVFNGSSGLTYDKNTNTLDVAGPLIANSLQMGSGIYKFSTTFVYFATTASGNPDQVLWATPVANINSIDFSIYGSCNDTDASQTAKISSLIRGNTVVYNEYAGLAINNGVGAFAVTYTSDDGVLRLIVDPDTSSITEYNIVITVYNNYP
jgi:hypothetical protein